MPAAPKPTQASNKLQYSWLKGLFTSRRGTPQNINNQSSVAKNEPWKDKLHTMEEAA